MGLSTLPWTREICGGFRGAGEARISHWHWNLIMITRTSCLIRTESACLGGVPPNWAQEEINTGLFQQEKKKEYQCVFQSYLFRHYWRSKIQRGKKGNHLHVHQQGNAGANESPLIPGHHARTEAWRVKHGVQRQPAWFAHPNASQSALLSQTTLFVYPGLSFPGRKIL